MEKANYLCLYDRIDIPTGYENYIWIDGGCIDGIRWCENHNLNFQIIPGYWKTDEDIENSSVYIKEVKRQALLYATDLLNDYHGTDYSVSEWNIMLSHWLDNYIVLFYDKYTRIKWIEAGEQICESDLFELEEICVPLDYIDYVRLGHESEKFHGYQYSQLIRMIGRLKHIEVIGHKRYIQDEIPVPKKTLGYYKTDVYRFLTDIYKNFTHSQEKVVLQESYLPNDFLLEVMMRRPGVVANYVVDYHRHEKIKFSRCVDQEWRMKEDSIQQYADEFTTLIFRLLKWNIPIAYVEDFEYLQKRAKRLFRHASQPRAVIYACGGTSYNEIFKTYLMSLKRTNVKFYDVQHGGNYGIDKHYTIYNEMEISDYLYTWGWNIENKLPCKCRPMPAAKLMDNALQNVKMGEDILYVNYGDYKHICSLSRDNIFYKREKEAELQFLKSLSSNTIKQLVIRLYPNSYGWGVKEDIERNIPNIRFDKEPSYYKSLNRAKCVVLMQWSTTILEALYADKPVIVLRKEGSTEPDALQDLQELEKVGILVKDWDALAKRLDEISSHIEEWWKEPKRQAAVERIRNKYMYMPRNAKEIWVNELLRLADE